MCGIVGYVGAQQSINFLLEGLSRLEYRGYDSAGVALSQGSEKISCYKAKGRLKNLEDLIAKEAANGTLGIGHTRWATHGEPSFINSHPHLSEGKAFAVVHNGIIENYGELREHLTGEGYSFLSETDTEVIPNLIDHCYKSSHNFLTAVRQAVRMLKGSYALGILCEDAPDTLIGVRKDSPLIVGINPHEEENYLASDIPAILSKTRDIYLLDDGDICVLTKNQVRIYDMEGKLLEREIFHVDWDAEASEKGGYDHFMLKEIHEQPQAARDTMKSRLAAGQPVNLDQIHISKEALETVSHVYIVACGTAYHAGLVGKAAIERLARIPVDCDIASEFRFRDPIVDENTLVIVLSQSGETADTLAAMRLARKRGARIIAITNVVGSTISREADDLLYTWAGPEIAVASTKAYTTQLVAMYMVAIHLAEVLGTAGAALLEHLKQELLAVPEKIEATLERAGEIKEIAQSIAKEDHLFFIGRSLDYCVAMEGSLKLKEISYIHCEAYGAGELKHGTIALIEPGTYVLAIAAQHELGEKMTSNIKEVKSRGAKVISFVSPLDAHCRKESDQSIVLPEIDSLLAPLVEVVPLQLLAYYVSVAKGCDVDKPRNLAKSVTVE